MTIPHNKSNVNTRYKCHGIIAFGFTLTHQFTTGERIPDDETPPYLQDAIDNMLADEALAEQGESRPLRELLAETGEAPGQ
jgi:hypothetical protein